jgi:hypothetical protein
MQTHCVAATHRSASALHSYASTCRVCTSSTGVGVGPLGAVGPDSSRRWNWVSPPEGSSDTCGAQQSTHAFNNTANYLVHKMGAAMHTAGAGGGRIAHLAAAAAAAPSQERLVLAHGRQRGPQVGVRPLQLCQHVGQPGVAPAVGGPAANGRKGTNARREPARGGGEPSGRRSCARMVATDLSDRRPLSESRRRPAEERVRRPPLERRRSEPEAGVRPSWSMASR